MTTKTKAKRFRIRREGATPEPGVGPTDLVNAPPAPAPADLPPDDDTTGPDLRPQPLKLGAPLPDAGQGATVGPADAHDAAQEETMAARRDTAARYLLEEDSETLPLKGRGGSKRQTTLAVALEPPPEAAPDAVTPAETNAPELTIDDIKHEGLTGRQLRMARRVALKYGLSPSSDFDAVLQLRARGIDPFERANMLELVPGSERSAVARRDASEKLPQTLPQNGRVQLPANGTPMERRQREIMNIQRDIARRRRRKSLQLMTRLAFFVALPTALAGYYYFRVATPMYSVNSEFLILQADATGGSGLGGLLSGTQFATNQDSIAVQSYLQSKDAMLRLDQDVGFKAQFSQPWIDPIQRLQDDPSNEAAYGAYKKFVKIGYDPTEGVIKMEVIAPEPDVAAEYSKHLISYAEERVDDLSLRKREDAMSSARESLEQAKQERREAQQRLVQLQEGTIVDPQAVIGTLRAQIAGFEAQLQEKELQLAALKDNSRPNAARVDGVQADIDRLKQLLSRLNKRMTDTQNNDTSLAAKTTQVQLAQADLSTSDMFLQSALQNEKQTELEANRQVRYLTTSVRPVAPQDPSYPRAFENTLLVFLVLSGVYLMISLTGAILREQVST